MSPEIHVSYPFIGIEETKTLKFFPEKVCMVDCCCAMLVSPCMIITLTVYIL